MQLSGDELSDGRFAGAHETDQRDVLDRAGVVHRLDLTDRRDFRTRILAVAGALSRSDAGH
jgi:hypothetical protein